MSEQLQIAIVGGGIGGLTAALALRARGLNVTVFEQAGVLPEIGAGVTIFPNAALLLQRIGLTDGIKEIGSAITSLLLRTSLGELINPPALTSTGVQGYNVHRAEFLKLLIDAQPKSTLRLEHRLCAAKDINGHVQLTFSNGATVDTDIVIGADGIHSALQREIGLKTYPSSEGNGLQRPDSDWAAFMGEKHRRRNVDVDRERSQFYMLPRVARPIDEYGRLCSNQFGF
jgi:salicylate hydroxylase